MGYGTLVDTVVGGGRYVVISVLVSQVPASDTLSLLSWCGDGGTEERSLMEKLVGYGTLVDTVVGGGRCVVISVLVSHVPASETLSRLICLGDGGT